MFIFACRQTTFVLVSLFVKFRIHTPEMTSSMSSHANHTFTVIECYIHYQPGMRMGNAFGHACLSVCRGGARNFHLGARGSGGGGAVGCREKPGRDAGVCPPKAEAVYRHCLQILTVQKRSKFENFCTSYPVIFDQSVSRCRLCGILRGLARKHKPVATAVCVCVSVCTSCSCSNVRKP